MSLDHNILLESGTNEFEIVEFIVKGIKPYNFCINVAKVREVIVLPEVVHVPDAHPCIIGTANIRQSLVPIINLGQWLGIKGPGSEEELKSSKVIVTYFNGAANGFLVDEVVRIHRITWADIRDYSSMTDMQLVDTVLGVVNIGDQLVQLLDFERIVADINPTTMTSQEAAIDMSRVSERMGKHIFLAEDSVTIRKLLVANLTKAGYTVSAFDDGGDLLEEIEKNRPDIVVTDLEMPGTSGDYLVRRLRENSNYGDLPIIVFSSMASEENERKLKSIGANMFIGKPELNFLIKSVDSYMIDN
ncbi:MAG: chemotaxis protein CheV [Deferribacterales bacterium]|nr:chemotaxis protein CheV [Deferribacterales bacterium]